MMRSRWFSSLAAAAALVTGGVTLAGCGSGGSYTFSAVLKSGLGVYPGSHVQILGLDEGQVTAVRNEGDHVVVTMSLPSDKPVPADVHANVVAPEILGQHSVDLEPGYSGGARLASGAVIPISRTSVPVETNTILREVTKYLKQLNPNAVHDLVSNLSQDLNGQGQALNQLIGNAAATIQLLADKGNQLGQLNGTLAQLTGSLDSRTAAIEKLITDYDGVSQVIAQERTQLDGAIQALSQASTQLASFLNPNLAPLAKDIATLTTVGRTIDRNLGSVDTILSSSAALYAGAKRSYDPAHMWINLNNAEPPGTNAQLISDELRDRLAGVCRRILAHHSAGLPASAISTLNTCGNPASGFFDPIFTGVVNAVNNATGDEPPPSAQKQQQQYQQGLSMIPGLSPQQQQQLLNPSGGGSSPSTSSTSTTSTTQPSSLLPPLKPFSSKSSNGVLGVIADGMTGWAHTMAHSLHFLWGWL